MSFCHIILIVYHILINVNGCLFFLNQANICQVMPKKPFSTHIVYTPNLHTRLQSLLCEAKFSKEDFCKVLVIKFWIKWGAICENLTGSCQVMPQKLFWAQLPQIYILEPSPHVRLNFQKKKRQSVGHKVLKKNEGLRGYLWKSGNRLPSYAQKITLNLFAPNLYTRTQPPWGSKFSIKKKSSLFHEILNKLRGCMWKSDGWLPSYTPKTILGPFALNPHTRPQSPCRI